MATEDWHDAGFTDEYKHLGKQLGSGSLVVPSEIELSADRQSIKWRHGSSPSKHVRPEPALLDEFVRVWEMTPAAILSFAKRWGVLFLGADGRPCQPFKGRVPEPIETWRYFSRRAAAVLNLGASLNKGLVGSLDDWAALRGTSSRMGSFLEELRPYAPFSMTIDKEYPFDSRSFGAPDYERDVKSERVFLMQEMYRWSKLGRVGLVSSPPKNFSDGIWNVEIDFSGCFLSAVALQLALTLADVDALFTCSGCGVPYARRSKRPKPGQSNFCPSCTKSGEALRQADQRRRARVAEVRKLSTEEGLTAAEIAKRVDVDPARIRMWLKKKGKNNGKTPRAK